MDPEEYWKMMRELDESYEAMMKDDQITQEIEDSVISLVKELVGKLYAEEVMNLTAEGYKALNYQIWKHARDLSTEISNIIYDHTQYD